MVPDSELLEAAQQGDQAAFGEIVRRHQGSIYGFLRARLLQASDAEDLAQETFLRAYTVRARFDSSCLVRPWLKGIARNVLREHARKGKRRREVAWTELCLELDEHLDQGDAMYDDMLAHLPRCLDSLGPSARQAIDLRYTCKLRLAEIGSRLRRSEGATKLLMFRARQALRNCLERAGQEARRD
ncbi:MAG TPA: sigma-70 family RNA polymerase sigma factor [Pirellulales bacterium]|jgi:RNA polymerase sigma-70 factor (ECF subfamily)|nr:sigma-70 family RNA polymerase sigma factor [Pirellulales bacterium]